MSKIKELKDKHPDFIIDIIQMLSERDPSGKNKYLKYMIGITEDFIKEYLASGSFLDQSFVQLLELVNDFERLSEKKLIKEKDIYSYTSPEDVEKAINEAKEIEARSLVKKSETITLYEDDDCLLLKPLTEASATIYGKSTKWCTSSTKEKNRFDEYGKDGVLLYFLWKHPPKGLNENWHKIAINKKNLECDGTIWDALDEEIPAMSIIRIFNATTENGTDKPQRRMGILINLMNDEYDMCIPNMSLNKGEDGKYICSNDIVKEVQDRTGNSVFDYMEEKYYKY